MTPITVSTVHCSTSHSTISISIFSKHYRLCLHIYTVLCITSHKAVPYLYPVHMPSSSSHHIDDIHNLFHSTLLNITHNNFHIYLQHSLFCPHLLLYTAGSVLQYTLQVYHTVSNYKKQFIILRTHTHTHTHIYIYVCVYIYIYIYIYIHLINVTNCWTQDVSDAI